MDETDRPDDAAVRQIFWTGGWDSSFLVLDAVITQGHTVDPIYVRDPNRRSTDVELRAMERMREAVQRQFGKAVSDRIAPTRIFAREDIPTLPDIRAARQRLCPIKQLGSQYPWLAEFARWQGIHDIEMALHDIAQPTATMVLLKPLMVYDGTRARIAQQHRDSDWGLIFGDFTFPIATLFKTDMAAPARAHGFLDILEMAHFCHRPGRGDRPCGLCVPCHDAISTGMGYRVGWRGRVAHRLKHTPLLALPRRLRRAAFGKSPPPRTTAR